MENQFNKMRDYLKNKGVNVEVLSPNELKEKYNIEVHNNSISCKRSKIEVNKDIQGAKNILKKINS